MDKRFKYGWVIKILSKDEDGFQIELADLGNSKHMIVATDITHPVAKDTYRQAGFGPFLFEENQSLINEIQTLKNDLLSRRSNE